jgi:hypothetical protein
MAQDDNDILPSIISFSEDVSTQEAPNPLPNGVYTGEIVSAVIAKSDKGKLYGNIGFKISADQYPADFKDGNPDGTTIQYRRVPLEDNNAARFQLRQFCNAVGVVVSRQFDPAELLGHVARVHVVPNVFEGITTAQIKKVESAE